MTPTIVIIAGMGLTILFGLQLRQEILSNEKEECQAKRQIDEYVLNRSHFIEGFDRPAMLQDRQKGSSRLIASLAISNC